MRRSFSCTAVRLPAAFQRLGWSNLVAQSAEQLSLAAAPLVAVFAQALIIVISPAAQLSQIPEGTAAA